MVRAALDSLTPLQQRIVEHVRDHGPATADKIALALEVHDGRFLTPQAVRSACAYARGMRWLDDGSVSERIGNGFAWSPGPSPICWRFIPDDEATANVAEGRWL
jgi:hypothetical protein